MPMNSGFQFFDIVLFALVAVFILLRLRNTLGSRPDKEDKPPSNWSGQGPADDMRADPESDNIINLPGPDHQADFASPPLQNDDLPIEIAGGVTEIRLADPHFDLNKFLEGAAFAYEMVLTAFGAENYETLRQLLADSVYDDFAAALRHREERGESLETILVAIDAVDPIEVRMNGSLAEVTIKFAAEVVNVLRDAEGEILSGEIDVPEDVIDIWTFIRDVKSTDPNWQIAATRKAN